MTKTIEADVLIIGGGVAGTAIARELSKYEVETLLIDKEPDVGMGVSKTAHGYVYTGTEMVYSKILKSRGKSEGPTFDDPHTAVLKEGFPQCHELMHSLDVPHGHGGVLIIATKKEEMALLEDIGKYARQVHSLDSSRVRVIDRETLFEIETNITKEAIAALYDPECILDMFPQEFIFALAENARHNGVNMLFDTKATGFSIMNGDQIVTTNKGAIKAKYIINAAGNVADRVADLAGARDDWEFSFTRHQIILFDKRLKGLVHNHIRTTPQGGILNLVSPLAEGNLCASYGAKDIVTDRKNTATNRESFDKILDGAKGLIPSLSEADVITSYVGLTLSNTRNDHIVESSKQNPKFINVVLRMPGFTAAPPSATRVVALLADQGLPIKEKGKFKNTRKAIPRFRELSDEEGNRLISDDPRYGHVVCRCETVTEGEIVEAIRRGANTVQGVQFRTRAGMGRCQSGFCGPRLVNIQSKELGIPPTEVTKKGGASRILLYRSKELLEGASRD